MKTKEIKLNGYILPNNVKDNMEGLLDKTSKEEIGFVLCSKDNIIRRGKYFVGSPSEMIVDPRTCEKDEKFLGAYHTHPKDDSQPSARDLRYCGIFKIVCTGGKADNKIRCHTWKYEQPSVDEYNKMIYDISEDKIEPKNPKYKQNFGCINDILPLYLEEKRIKEKVDEDLRERELRLLSIKGSVSAETIEEGGKLFEDTVKRDIYANILKKETGNRSKKYYNEMEIK